MRERIRVIPNGVDTSTFSPPDGRDPNCNRRPLEAIFVGSEWERKGLRVAIEALQDLPQVRLTVVGNGDTDSYRNLSDELGVSNRVMFAGSTPEVAQLYRTADAFVLPTAYETFSLVAYEAAASGLPLLITKVNGVEDLLRDGVNGWFIDRDPATVRARLRELHSDPGLRAAMGTQARRDSLRFSWSEMVEGYRRLYRKSFNGEREANTGCLAS
jgi:UDP-glucose:(heptosyl)LPS alpha-1,3-glucosyltransferase